MSEKPLHLVYKNKPLIENVTSGQKLKIDLKLDISNVTLRFSNQQVACLDWRAKIITKEERANVTPVDRAAYVLSVDLFTAEKKCIQSCPLTVYYILAIEELYKKNPFLIVSINDPPTKYDTRHFIMQVTLQSGSDAYSGMIPIEFKKNNYKRKAPASTIEVEEEPIPFDLASTSVEADTLLLPQIESDESEFSQIGVPTIQPSTDLVPLQRIESDTSNSKYFAYDYTKLSSSELSKLLTTFMSILGIKDCTMLPSYSTGLEVNLGSFCGRKGVYIAWNGSGNLINDINRVMKETKLSSCVLFIGPYLDPQFSNTDFKIDALYSFDIFLNDHPNILLQYYSLFIQHLLVLQKLLHSGTLQCSEFSIDAAKAELQSYLEMPGFRSVINILENYGFCIINGSPGMGKTELAKAITAYYAAKDYSITCLFKRNYQKVISSLDPESEIFLYQDDFLGAISLELSHLSDSPLTTFIQRVKANKGKWKFLVTSRHYILNTAKRHMKYFGDLQEFENLQYNIDVDWRSEHLRELFVKRYFKVEDICVRSITDDSNFNPRAILSVFKSKEPITTQAIVEAMKDPHILWFQLFEKLPPEQRIILYVRASMEVKPTPNELRKRAMKFCQVIDEKYFVDDISWSSAFTELNGSFLHISNAVDFYNPSVNEYVSAILSKDITMLMALIDMCDSILMLSEYIKVCSFNRNNGDLILDYYYNKTKRLLQSSTITELQSVCKSYEDWNAYVQALWIIQLICRDNPQIFPSSQSIKKCWEEIDKILENAQLSNVYSPSLKFSIDSWQTTEEFLEWSDNSGFLNLNCDSVAIVLKLMNRAGYIEFFGILDSYFA